MARKVDSVKCSAWIIMGSPVVGAILPCRHWGEGSCLRDLRTEANIPNSIKSGQCLADVEDREKKADKKE